MKNYRKHIDDFFREKLGAYSETPPPEVWDDLEKRLDGLTTVTPGAPYRWIWHFAIVSALLLLGVSVARKISDNPVSKSGDIALNGKAISNTVATPATAAAGNDPSSKPAAGPNVNEMAATGNAAQNAPGNTVDIKNDNTTGDENANNTSSSAPSSPADKTQRSNNPAAKQTPTNGHSASGKRTTEQPDNSKNTYAANYSSKSAKHGPAADDVNDNNQAPASPNTTLSSSPKVVPQASQSKKDEVNAKKEEAVAKKEAVNKAIPKAADKKDDKPAKADFARFEAGVKVGFEGGVSGGAASKFVVAPYLQYNLSQKFSLMVQPAVKAAYVSSKSIGSDQSYYSANEDGKLTEDYDNVTTHTTGASVIDTHQTKYTFTQTHSAIVKSNTFGGTYAEVELPILLKYALCKKMSVYGGVNLVYSKLMGVTEHTSTQQGILSSKDTTIVTVNQSPLPPSPPSNIGITYTGTSISQYKGPAYPGMPETQIRVGYMLGFTYACSKKWLFDALMEQTPAAADMKGGYNINTPLSSMYFRLSIGYKLTK